MSSAETAPPGFELVEEKGLQAIIRKENRRVLWPLVRSWASSSLPPSLPVMGGRGGARVVELNGSPAVVLRPYRRGGLLRRINKDIYLGVRPRPFQELHALEELRRRGVPTIEPLAGGVRWLFSGCYRGVLITREVPEAVNLWHWLRAIPPVERPRICAAAAAVTRRLHDAGVVHPDLNLQNYLVDRGGDDSEVLIIDCDRVRFGRVTMHDREAAFQRLYRSAKRLDPGAAIITDECLEQFHKVAR